MDDNDRSDGVNKVKIVSDGTATGTVVTVNGMDIGAEVTAITWALSSSSPTGAKVTMTLRNAEVEIQGDQAETRKMIPQTEDEFLAWLKQIRRVRGDM